MKKFLLLSPLQPSMFNLGDDDITGMVEGLATAGLEVSVVNTDSEIFFYATTNDLDRLNHFCTFFNLGGVAVEVAGVYDQAIQTELVPAGSLVEFSA